MHRHYYGFEIYSRAEPAPTTLLGRLTQWYAAATIDYVRRNGSLVQLTRLRVAGITFDESEIAEAFGLGLAWIVIGGCYRELARLRARAEKESEPRRGC